ncbi:MAG: hypothetical protein BGO41_09795 [Clostridiales bacterium 38-18]|nr:MAG: hypothetical protein BGO41_09795 [Clostridiales bacterium 38-18]
MKKKITTFEAFKNEVLSPDERQILARRTEQICRLIDLKQKSDESKITFVEEEKTDNIDQSK